MSNSVIVMISDLDDPKHGELNVIESHQKAARLVETLLESGFDQTRIRIFGGDEMGMQVAHRPVVSLVSGGAMPTSATPPEDETEVAVVSEKPALSRASSKAKVPAPAEVVETPFVQNGVRFSTQFKPA